MLRIEQHIRDLCRDNGQKEFLLSLLPRLAENIKSLDTRVTKRFSAIALLCAAFEFLSRSRIDYFSFSGMRVSDYRLIEIFLPVAVSYVLFDSAALISSRRLLEQLHDTIIRFLLPNLWAVDFELYLRPPHLLKTYYLIAHETKGWRSRAVDFSINPFLFVFSIVAPSFLLYASFRNVFKYGVDMLFLISAGLTLFFLAQAMLLFSAVMEAVKEPVPPEDAPEANQEQKGEEAPASQSADHQGPK